MVNPLISIIIPVFKAEKYLSKCLDSVLSQTFSDFELILIDDGSPDKSGEICEIYANKDGRVQVFHQKNGGVSKARNLGIIKAKGYWVTFVDADDFVSTAYLENLYIHTIDSSIEFVQAGCLNYYGEHNVSVEQCYEYKKDNDPIFLLNNIRGLAVSKLYNKAIILKNKIFYDENIKFAEDMVFTIDYIKYVRNYVFSSSTDYYYRRNNESVTRSKNIPSYESYYACFIHFYHSVVSFIHGRRINYADASLRFNQLGSHLYSTIISLFYNKIEVSLRKKHLHYDFKDIQFSLLRFDNLSYPKRLLLKIFLARNYDFFDFVTDKLFKLRYLKSFITNK